MKKLVFIVSIVGALLVQQAVSAQQRVSFQFAYLVWDYAAPELMVVDADEGQLTVREVQVVLSETYPVFDFAVSSPNGEWVAAFLSKTSNPYYRSWLLRLYHLQSGRFVDVMEGFNYRSMVNVLVPSTLEWSPDGTKLAVRSDQPLTVEGGEIPQGNVSHTLYIFDLSQARLTSLFTSSAGDSSFTFSWATNSQQILTGYRHCASYAPTSSCTAIFSVFDVGSPNVPRYTLDLAARGVYVSELLGYYGRPFCELKMSPDAQYVSFTAQCDYSGLVAHEVYTWDTQTDELSQLTDFVTSARRERPEILKTANYTTHWVANDTLLVSVFYGEAWYTPDERRFERTLSISLPSKAQTTVADVAIFHIDVNPLTGDLAYSIRANPPGGDALSFKPASTKILRTVSGVTRLTPETLMAAQTLVGGCFPQWSPDGRWLAYQRPLGTTCYEYGASGLLFFNPATGERTEYALPVRGPDNPILVQPVGWVRVQ
jgi:hypothetical protein